LNLRLLVLIAVVIAVAIFLFAEMSEEKRSGDLDGSAPVTAEVPARALDVLRYIDANHRAPDGYEGGRPFYNLGDRGRRPLPTTDDAGRAIRYQEWDIYPRRRGQNRGAERLVTGSNDSAYYTADHYRSFTKIR
jgi:ribonuclease T1